MVNRADKVRKALIREVSSLLQKGLKDPRISGIVSVTDVDISSDCRYAKIFVSVYGTEQEQAETMAGLASSTGFVRSEISKRIKMRFSPEIQFAIDNSLERGVRVTKILEQISKGEV